MIKIKNNFILTLVVVFVVNFLYFQNVNAATYFSDDFSSDFGELSTHTPTNTGTSWSKLISNGVDLYVQSYNQHVTVQSNTSNAGSFYIANGTYSTADYEVTVNQAFAGGGNDYSRSIAVRVQDANNMYLLRFSANTFQLYKRVSGVWSLIGSQSSTYPQGNTSSFPYTGDQVGLKALGNEISASINGTTVLTVTDSSITLAGQAGLGIGYVNISTDDGGTGVGVDNFVVQPVTSDVTSPRISSLSPVDDSVDVALDSDLIITFDEVVDVESGNITIFKSSGETVETIDVTSGQVTGTGTDTITINPSSDFVSGNSYYIQIDATAFDDSSSNSFAGISNSTTWNFRVVGGGMSKERYIEPLKPYFDLSEIKKDSVMVSVTHDKNNTKIDELGIDYYESKNKTSIQLSGFSGLRYFITGLKCNTRYEIDVYAKNSIEKVYSEKQSFKTLECEKEKDNTPDTSLKLDKEKDSNGLSQDILEKILVSYNLKFNQNLKRGDTLDDVVELQKILNKIGFTVSSSGPGSIGFETDYFGALTEKSLRDFQKSFNLKESGILDEDTKKSIKIIYSIIENKII